MISVIVPVYKVEKYLEKCVNSIRSQSYSDLEIILVMMDHRIIVEKYVMKWL